MKRQVVITFTLNVAEGMSDIELSEYLENNCPMLVSDERFEVSTEAWDICGVVKD